MTVMSAVVTMKCTKLSDNNIQKRSMHPIHPAVSTEITRLPNEAPM